MSHTFGSDILAKVVAQSCQMVGYDRVTNSCIFILTDMIRHFIRRLGQLSRSYAEHCGRSHVNMSDLSLAFYDFEIYPSKLLEFLQLVSPLPQSIKVPLYPVCLNNNYSHVDMWETIHMDNHETAVPKEGLKVKISLNRIKEAVKLIKKNKKKNKKKKMKKKKTKAHRKRKKCH